MVCVCVRISSTRPPSAQPLGEISAELFPKGPGLQHPETEFVCQHWALLFVDALATEKADPEAFDLLSQQPNMVHQR